MVIKVLFFDTSALIKLFVQEEGTEKVKWLTSNETRIVHSLHFVINEQVCAEFDKKLLHFVKLGKVTAEKAETIHRQFSRYYKGHIFKMIGQNIVSNTKPETDVDTVLEQLGLKRGADDWDGLIYQSIVNALAALGGQSHPILVCCDKRFGNKVKAFGYRVLNPEKQTTDEMLGIINRGAEGV